jgi:hypothetical protein
LSRWVSFSSVSSPCLESYYVIKLVAFDSFADMIGLKVCKKGCPKNHFYPKAKGTFIMYVFRISPGDYIIPFVLPKRTVRYIAQVCLISSFHSDFQNLSHREWAASYFLFRRK